jgi:hypothetical protein
VLFLCCIHTGSVDNQLLGCAVIPKFMKMLHFTKTSITINALHVLIPNAKCLATLESMSWTTYMVTAVFPGCLKYAVIKPFYKGDKSDSKLQTYFYACVI